jgi:hypothetical protein
MIEASIEASAETPPDTTMRLSSVGAAQATQEGAKRRLVDGVLNVVLERTARAQ